MNTFSVSTNRGYLVTLRCQVVISITACKPRVHLTRWVSPPVTCYTHMCSISQSTFYDHIELTNSIFTYIYTWRIYPKYWCCDILYSNRKSYRRLQCQ